MTQDAATGSPEPDAAAATRGEERGRGRLRVYLGAAPGVGKTYAMLGEGRRKRERGSDVVVALVETHGRRHTAAMLTGLEVVPRRTLSHRGAVFEEMDLEAVLRRRPDVALVDELAHTNVRGSRNAHRWEDVQELLAAGIDVITTVNVQHLESLNDVVEKITGVPQHETVPDAVVRAADQVELVDMSGEALRRRLAHGNVYTPEKIDAALGNYFRLGNLTALREIALLWTADRVEEALDVYRDEHAITGTWETRERVVVALTGGPEGETLVRRAHRIASRAGGELLAVHVTRSDGIAGVSQDALSAQRRLVESLGGSYHQVLGDDVPGALLAFARGENATQLVLGVSRRSRWQALLSGPGIGSSTVRASGDIDVHMVTHDRAGAGRLPRRHGALSRTRRINGFVLAGLLPVLSTLVLVPLRGEVNLVSDMLLFVLVTVVVSIVGGLLPALLSAVVGSGLLNYYFTPPLRELAVRDANNALALVVFVAVGMLVSSVVDVAARRTREAARSAAEARTLADLATSAFAGGDAVAGVLDRVRRTFALDAVTLLERDGGRWAVMSSAGPPCHRPEDAETCVPAGEGRLLAMRGRLLEADDRRLVGAFAAQVAALLERVHLSELAAAAGQLAAADRTRTALLAAVGHDLRTPLAAAKASVSGLLSAEVRLTPQDRAELLAAADESLDRLAALVEDLLDMSRLQAGALALRLEATAVDEVAARAVATLGAVARSTVVEIAADLPPVVADPGLLERVLANVVDNAVRFSPKDRPPAIAASRHADRVELRVVDRGPGLSEAHRDEMFQPFQRLGDTDNTTGVGLGLALARGLTEAMGGTLHAEDTPGGGLTMVVRLQVAATDSTPQPGLRERGRDGPVS